MFEFIVLLRALSAMIITNAHYENIYPISIIANGGLLGDVMFFAISGFCLYDIKTDFVHWYKKRLLRIYPSVWIITLVYTFLGYYQFRDISTLLSSFIFPTHYHFIGSIVLLYIPFYLISCVAKKNEKTQNRTIVGILVLLIIMQLYIYVFFYNKSVYHIDSVYEPMIRFLFLEAMIIGAIMKINVKQLIQTFSPKSVVSSVILFGLYFISKMGMVRFDWLAPYQIINQYLLLLLLVSLFIMVAGTEKTLPHIPNSCRKVIIYISNITLEIYLVQYVIIDWLNKGPFPVNFFIVTSGILIVATVLHFITSGFLKNKIICF